MKDDRAPELEMAEAAKRLAVLRPYLDGETPLARAAADAGVPLRTAWRWLACYWNDGPAGLARPPGADTGTRKITCELVGLTQIGPVNLVLETHPTGSVSEQGNHEQL